MIGRLSSRAVGRACNVRIDFADFPQSTRPRELNTVEHRISPVRAGSDSRYVSHDTFTYAKDNVIRLPRSMAVSYKARVSCPLQSVCSYAPRMRWPVLVCCDVGTLS